MERNRIIAVICAVIAAVCVMAAGKSCADDAIKQRKSSTAHQPADNQPASHGIEINTGSPAPTDAPEVDLFGNPIVSTTVPENVEYDLFGRPITTAPPETETTPIVTDENGEVIEAPSDEDTSAEAVSEEETTDESTEESEQQAPTSTAPPKISGFNHGQYDDEGNLKPTLPPDFAIIIR